MPRWLALLSCALGLALVAAGTWRAARARDTGSWVRAAGRILEARVEEEHGGPREQGWPRYRFTVRYGYEARGRTYESDQIWIGSRNVPSSQDREAAEEWVDRFPVGREVDVWFDPADPGRAVLVRGAPRGEVAAYVAIGLALLGAGIFVLARMPPR